MTNDLLEKEFGLDPTTIDTASSHMLDAWNMTFDLGVDSSNPAVPSQFQAWNEAPGFNYSRACAYPGEPSGECSQRFTSSIASEPSNLSDNSWWASRVLWSAAALATLETLMARENVGWLRAVSGTTIITGSSGLVSERTLTVWGKLSWGANPLAQSTILGGGSDGSRLSPLSSVDLQLYAVYSRLGATPCSNNAPPSGGANGWAVQLELNDTNSLGSVEIANYTTPTSITSSSQCGGVTRLHGNRARGQRRSSTSMSTCRIVVNKTGTLIPLSYRGSSTTATLSLDMFSQGATGSTTCSASGQTEIVLQSNDGNSVCLQWKPVSAGGKAPTWLFVPTLNGTLSANPWGLKRYVGEQSFDLLVVNNPTGQPITSMNVPTQWGSYYSVTLQTGLNNFLVPRTQFLYSSLGQGIVLGSNLTDRNLTVTPPILGTNELNAISLGGASPLQNISCYWQNLAINDNSAHTAICSAESGTTKGTSDAVRMIGDAGTRTGNNCGGIPGNPGAESGNRTAEGAALQAVAALNISSPTRLDLLLAGLMDNATGGINGTFQLVTNQIASLGLAKAVVTALANATVTSNGLYTSPTSVVPPPPPPSNGLWGALWNAVSGFTSWVVNGITLLASVVWTAALAIANFANQIAQGLQAFAENPIGATVAALKVVGRALLAAAEWVANFIVSQIRALLNRIVQPILSSIASYVTGLNVKWSQAWSSYNSSGQVTQATSNSIGSTFGGPPFLAGLGIAIAVTVALTVLTPLDFGPAFLVGIVIGVIAGAALASGVVKQAVASLSSSAVLTLESIVDPGIETSGERVGYDRRRRWSDRRRQ